MEPTRKKNNKWIDDASIADVLCSTGYLPPRNVQDLVRFERIYNDRTFETEKHHIDADAIFDRVMGEARTTTIKMRPVTTIYDRPGMLRVAEGVSTKPDDSVAEMFNHLFKDEKD